jgi:hypothetical protein
MYTYIYIHVCVYIHIQAILTATPHPYLNIKVPDCFIHRLIVQENRSIVLALELGAAAMYTGGALVKQHLGKVGRARCK